MQVTVGVDGLIEALLAAKTDISVAATGAMRDAVTDLKLGLRDQVRGAGLGNKLANTWRGETYPKGGASLDPAGYVWSKAPNIISAYAEGATIVPLAGLKYLAIPTANVPRRGGRRGASARMSPFEVETSFNQDLIIRRGKRGTLLGFVNAVAARSARRPGLRRATKGRVAAGREIKFVLMFVFVRSVRVAKVLDVVGAANKASARFGDALSRRLPG